MKVHVQKIVMEFFTTCNEMRTETSVDVLKKFCSRFSSIALEVLKNLEQEEIAGFKKLCEKKEKCLLIRLIKGYVIEHEGEIEVNAADRVDQSWDMMLNESSLETLKRLAKTSEEFFYPKSEVYNGVRSQGEMYPLHMLALMGDLDLYKIASKGMFDKNPKNKLKNTPLHFAALKGDLEMFKYIYDRQVHEHPRNNIGSSPFHMAAKHGHVKICEFILENTEEKYPEEFVTLITPYNRAQMNNHANICTLIENFHHP